MSEKIKTVNGLQIIEHRMSKDAVMDVPFRIAGHQLRWVSPYVQSSNAHRQWRPLRKSDLDAATWNKMKERYMGFFNDNDGDTIRYGDLVLSYMPTGYHDAMKKEKQEIADMQYSKVYKPNNKNIKIDRQKTEITKEVSKDFFDR